jgi:hypothetical protein
MARDLTLELSEIGNYSTIVSIFTAFNHAFAS